MKNNIQAIININGADCFYLYDDDIKNIILNTYKRGLEADGKKIDSISVELNSPSLKYDELKNRKK